MFEPDEVFDSREVIDRIEELEDIEVIDRTPEEQEELDALYELQEQCTGFADWEYGETFIRDDYFEEYTREFLKDVGYVPDELPSWIVIDWEETADNLKEDYTSVEFQGETYWARS